MTEDYDLNPYRALAPTRTRDNPKKEISVTNLTPYAIKFVRMPSTYDSVNFAIVADQYVKMVVDKQTMANLMPEDTITLHFNEPLDEV